MNPRNFFGELKRRNVYKVAVAYAVVAWLLIQVTAQIFPFFDIPNWGVRLIVLIVVIGFPVALVLAWAFELTPEGLKRTGDVSPEESITRVTGRKLDFLIIAVLLVVIGLLVFVRHGTRPVASDAAAPEKSIAVLPLENLSEEKENAFFADGIQDDILTSLAKIRDLKVISRTSVMSYRGNVTRNLREIGRALGVANVLEGSVRREGVRVLVNVQLIDARNDHHLWAEHYDRTLVDVLTLQGELASEIATALRAKLSPDEKARVEARPTDNADAYVFYLRAREYQTRQSALLSDLQTAEALYEQALQLDAKFALAHARLSETVSRIHHWFEPTDARKSKARREAEESLRLRADLGEGRVALALCFYWGAGDYENALREFAIARQALPNNAAIELYTASIRRRQGYWSEARAGFQSAQKLDPRNAELALQIANLHFFLRDWAAAAEAWDRVVALTPDVLYPRRFRAYIDLLWKGDPTSSKNVLASVPAGVDTEGLVTLERWNVALMQRDFGAAERAVSECRMEAIPAVSGPPLPKSYLEGCIALARGDVTRARVGFELARPSFESALHASPQDATRHAYLGLVYAYLGRREDAIREGRRAMELKPESKDALDGAQISGFMALIYARSDEPDPATNLIERLITTPGAVDNFEESITLIDLRMRWEWDPLRNDPRFQKILAGPEPKTIYK
ncbi:MAG: hypothetical protein ACR2MF_06200 [Chthoniobacterales bacterium]